MARLKKYVNVRVSLCAPDHVVRANIHLVLTGMGFTNIRDTDNLTAVREGLADNDTDLLIIDTTQCLEEATALLRQVRNQDLGNNPFPIAVALNEDAASDKVKKVVDAGFDTMVLSPLDPFMLRQRLGMFLRSRAPFITARNYVGPDRRDMPRPGAPTAPLIPVPNPVKLMASGTMSRNGLARVIDRVSDTLATQKVSCLAREAVFLAESVATQRISDDEDPIVVLKRLFVLVNSIREQTRRMGLPHVSGVCTTLLHGAKRLVTDGNVQRGDLERLPKLAATIEGALAGEIDLEAEHDYEIDDLLKGAESISAQAPKLEMSPASA